MDELEEALKIALAREAAPPALANQIVAKAQSQRRWRGLWWRIPALRWALAALVIGGFIVAGSVERERRQRIQGQKAREQVLLALRITGSKLHALQQGISRSSRREGEAQ